MSYKAVMEFLESTSKDEALQNNLSGLLGIGDGDISSAEELDGEEAEALMGERGIKVTALAEEKGFIFTLGELNAIVNLFQRYRTGKLSQEDFAKAMGWDSQSEALSTKLESLGKTVNRVYLGVKYTVEKEESSAHQVLDFMKKTSEDAVLREQLKVILDVGDGDIGDFSEIDAEEANALRSGRGVLVAEFAAKHGFIFTLSDLLAVTDAFERVQAGELSNEDFEKFLSASVDGSDYFPFISNVVSMTYKGFKYASPVVSKVKDNTLPVVRFMERSSSDAALREQLMAIIGGDGDISSPGELDAEEASSLVSDRSNSIVSLGAEHGYRFTVTDLNAVISAFQLVNEEKLSMESCARILGMGKSDTGESGIKKTAGLIYRVQGRPVLGALLSTSVHVRFVVEADIHSRPGCHFLMSPFAYFETYVTYQYLPISVYSDVRKITRR
jgi:hypothetical protein